MVRLLCVLAALGAGFSSPSPAQSQEPLRLTIPRITTPPALADLLPMDAPEELRGMRRLEGFVERFPNDGSPVSEATIAYIGYDADNVYVAFLCFDREPHAIGAHLVGRDAFPNDEDSVAVHFDTFRDLKHAYGFQVNPLGVQTDGIYTEGTGWDLSWDAVWHSEGRLTPRGYVVLLKIPFKSLRFPPSEIQHWGLFLYRGVARRNEDAFWPACSTRLAARFPQAVVMDGIGGLSAGRNVQAIPSTTGRSSRLLDRASEPPIWHSHAAEGDLGVDAKAVIRDSVILDATVNPDFSQVESDQPQITVNKPFEVLFPEKRPFFLENATLFETPIHLLFTRRIANPLFGARATGRLGGFSGAAMLVDDRSPFDAGVREGRAWYGALRAIRDLGRESLLGGFFSTRSLAGSENQVVAADLKAKFGSNLFGTLQAASSRTRAADAPSLAGSAWLATILASGRRFSYELDLNDRSPDFRAADGFIPRVDMRSVDQTLSFRARPSRGALQAWGPDLVLDRTWDHAGRPLDWSVTPRFAFQWPRATSLEVFHTAGRQTLRPAEVAGLDHPLATPADRTGASFATALVPRLIGSTSVFLGDAPNLNPVGTLASRSGRVLDATATISFRLSRELTLDSSYLFDRLQDTQARRSVYSNQIVRLRAATQFTRAFSVRGILEYDQLSVDPMLTTLVPTRTLNYDLLFTYLASPGTALYLGANYGLSNLDSGLTSTAPGRSLRLNNDSWQVFVKISYLIRP